MKTCKTTPSKFKVALLNTSESRYWIEKQKIKNKTVCNLECQRSDDMHENPLTTKMIVQDKPA